MAGGRSSAWSLAAFTLAHYSSLYRAVEASIPRNRFDQVDSNIWQGTTDFRAALISLAWAHALYSGDLRLVRK